MSPPRTARVFLCLCTLLGCAETLPPQSPPTVVSPAAKRGLEAASAAHREIQESLAAVPVRDRETCEFQVGDCSLVVKEQESRLLEDDAMSSCQVLLEANARVQCLADRLVAKGQHEMLSAYYSFHDSCTRQVLTCVEGLAERAAASIAESRLRTRREEIERSDRSVVARAKVEGKRAGVAYLRATLPPTAAASCELSDRVDSCLSGAQAKRGEIEAELRSDSFDAGRAAALSESLARAEAECFAPEVACLQTALGSYGLLPEARKVAARNLELLVRREELRRRVSARATTSCLTPPSGEYQQRIVTAYVAYVREPVLYFRRELDRAFRDLHESQVACLTARARVEPSATSAQR